MSQVLTPLDTRYIDGLTWQLLAPFVVESDVLGGRVEVAAGFITDFNSVPRALWNLLPPEEFGESAVVHDALYRAGQWRGRALDRGTVDRVHREFLLWRRAPAWKVAAMYAGIRLGGWVSWRRYRQIDASAAAA